MARSSARRRASDFVESVLEVVEVVLERREDGVKAWDGRETYARLVGGEHGFGHAGAGSNAVLSPALADAKEAQGLPEGHGVDR